MPWGIPSGGLGTLNVACWVLSNLEPMRLISISVLIATVSTLSTLAATPEIAPMPTVPAAAAEQGKDVVHQLNNAFAKVFETVAPSVVIIEISKKSDNETSAFEDLFFQGPPDENNPRRNQRNLEPIQSEGSGFIVRPDGYIFTNFHVVEAADKIEVKLKDGREFSAKVVGTDEKTDIAVIKIEAKDLPVAQLGDSDAVRVGQFAFAIGAPFKLDYTFTYGVVSGKGRSKLLATSGYSISDYLQTDASINPGNSGGPLCDIDGKVIGMNTLINGINRGLGFAIPSNMAKEIGEELIAGHKITRPWLGIRIETLGDDPSIRELFKGVEKGVVVRTIEADAPAYKSDLRPFDVITQVDANFVSTDSQLQHEILKKKIGQKVELTVWRKGQTLKVPVTTGELPNEISRASNEPARPPQNPEEEAGKFGLQVQELTKEMAQRFKLGVQRGVIVTDVTENSLAAQQGIEREDVITEVDSKPVTDAKTFREALNKADPKRGVLLYLDRKGSKTFAVLKASGGEPPDGR
ncbi:MAG TPA: trypsin-like peptidase domain-containing protein [Chthoniobacterales bacterium]|jgi:serine protease Do|nr:trypsin-like peptidase domain-containing protein [Chthoniobacterales bacterium]